MSLVVTTLQVAIKTALNAAQADTTSPPAKVREDLTQALAQAIDAYIRSGTVLTTGSATAQTGAIT